MNDFLALFSSLLIRFIAATLRMKVEDRAQILDQPDHPPVIIAFWHNRTALMAFFYEHYCRGRTALTFISRSRDGQFMTNLAARFGIRAARGSSSRHGASAALTAIRASGNPRIDLVITPDGPRGPRYQIQPGLLRLAQATGRPIVAITYHLPWRRELKSWDHFHVALPFSRCYLITQPPVVVPEKCSETEMEEIVARLTTALGGD